MRIYTNKKCKVCGSRITEIIIEYPPDNLGKPLDGAIKLFREADNIYYALTSSFAICENGHKYEIDDYGTRYHEDQDSLEICFENALPKDDIMAKIISENIIEDA